MSMQEGSPSPGPRPRRPQWWPMFTGHSEVAYVPAPWVLKSPNPGNARVHQAPRTPPPTCTEKCNNEANPAHISSLPPGLKCVLHLVQVLACPRPLEPQASNARGLIWCKGGRVEPQGPRMFQFTLGHTREKGLVTSNYESLLP